MSDLTEAQWLEGNYPEAQNEDHQRRLQDALAYINTDEHWVGWSNDAMADMRRIVEAARLVADPNYEAARVETAAWFDGYRKSSEITAATWAIVAAALTGDTG